MDFIVILIALILSAFFSGMELAFVAANRLRIELDRKSNPLFDYIVKVFLRHPGQYISTMLVGNNIALVVYSLFMSQVLAEYLFENIALETLISTLLIIITAEFLPKGIVKISPNKYFRILAMPAMLFYIVFYPITKFMELLSMGLLYLVGQKPPKQSQQSPGIYDLQHLVDNSSEVSENADGVDQGDMELQILQNFLEFPELKVRECMIPRVEVVAYDADGEPAGLLKLFNETLYSRIPLYRDTVDNIVGYASARNMFRSPEKLSQITQEMIYVPESRQIKKLLEEFIRRHKSMAVVIDEYGATAGIITLEDILEEIVGEIEDEHDLQDDNGVIEEVLGEGHYRLSARLEIDYLNEHYGFDIPESEEYETLAGYVLFNSEELPQMGSSITLGGLIIKILSSDSNRISLVEVTLLGEA